MYTPQISLDLPVIIGLSVTAVGITLQRGAADHSVIVSVIVLFTTIGLVSHITNVLHMIHLHSQWKSPFDTCPATTSPVSLTNLQVSVGGQNVLQSTLQYGYEHFLEQVNLAEQLSSSDFGISTGLINQNYWENSKWYYVNVERGNAADKLNGRNINVSFTNNSNVPVEIMVFIFYSDEIAIDVKTGLVTRHKN